jgi:ribosome recycling factor
MSDGRLVRLPIPPLTEERRHELVKKTRHMAENSRVAIRNVRRTANERIKKAEKDGDLAKDEAHRALERIQELTDEHIAKLDKLLERKSAEITEI